MKTPRLSATEWRLALLLAAVAAAQVWLVHDLRFLASGLFGGDHAYQLACIRSIAASLDPMASCNLSGALPLAFDCRRDADFKISDASFIYDPWSAKVT